MSIVDVPPRFAIVPVGTDPPRGRIPIFVEESRAFGDGSHPTTRVCLEAVGALAPRDAWTMLDFGSGNGVLSIAGAKLGARAVGVEIDEGALQVAARNAKANDVDVSFVRTLPDGKFDLVVGNILRSVLVHFASELATRARSTLVLSGLTSTDVPEVSDCYARLLGRRPEIYERGEWRALAWRKLSS